MVDKVLLIENYNYPLPLEKIALRPLEKRDSSKLLVYKEGKIEHHTFDEISNIVDPQTLFVFNETKVIYARLHAKRQTGGQIEILLLEPILPSKLMQQQLQAKSNCVWQCMVGNKKKWKENEVIYIQNDQFKLTISWQNKESNEVKIDWEEDITFAEILHQLGEIPIPPYIQREAEEKDKEVYQTIYSKNEGSVAAPTAGLHFTPSVFKDLEKKGIKSTFVTLHVGAGTFLPVKTENALEHEMHREFISIEKSTLINLIKNADQIIPVGTTSMRSLESLYWFGCGLIQNSLSEFSIPQFFPYQQNKNTTPTVKESLDKVLEYMNSKNLNTINGYTSIMIYPGYEFKICKGIVTNFHQPCSTLLLLISALIGENWKIVYQEALEKEYRFLSFGDASLLYPNKCQ